MIYSFGGKRPSVHRTVFIHPRAVLIGDVRIGPHSSVWPGAVIRGDMAGVEIGSYTCIQDNAVVHSGDEYERKNPRFLPTKVGDYVVVGHNSLLHGCTIEDNCLVGAGSVVFNGARVCEGSLVGIGAVVLRGERVPPKTVVVGIPARVLRTLSDEEVERTRRQAETYAEFAEKHRRAVRSARG